MPAQTLTRGPSVWETEPTSFRVAFQTSGNVQGRIDWGPTEALGNTTSGNSTTIHAIRITGLQPDHFYWYRVRLQNTPVTPVFRTRTFASATSAAAGSDVSFFVFGDCGSGSSNQIRVANLVHSWDWDLGLLAGDIIYPDGQASGLDPYFFTPYGATLRSTPFYPVLGNHDYHTSNGQPYLDAFYLPTANSGTERWYSFDHGKVHFIGLDSNQVSTTTQTTWLRNDLIAARANNVQWIFATLHHPPYSSGTVHGREQSVYDNWCPIFEEFEVDAVFTGHDHIYERTTVRRDFYPNKRGVVYYVVGTGGAGLYSISPEPYSAYATSRFGALKVDVRGNVFRSVFLDGNSSTLGQQLDAFSMTRGPVTPALRATSPSPEPGQSFQGAFDGPNGAFRVLFAALQSGYAPVPGLGLVQIGSPNTILTSGPIGSTQTAAFSLAVPNQPALVGASLFFQGITLNGPSLSMQLTDLLPARVR
ncbi:MAG TPA: metallophosphoesterase family protein [Planctomycetota bacterium]|nr:metallophosphoesterase family protein [Planctomycetota bacterium]